MSISCDSVLMAASRWSISVAAVGSVGFIPCSWVLSVAIWLIAALAWPTEMLRSCSALVRSVWMPCVVELSCCASAWAAFRAAICDDELPEVVDSDCRAVVKFE